jgi:hypothetical protein
MGGFSVDINLYSLEFLEDKNNPEGHPNWTSTGGRPLDMCSTFVDVCSVFGAGGLFELN